MIPTFVKAIPGNYTGPTPTSFRQLLGIVAENTTYLLNDEGTISVYTGDTAPTDTTGIWFQNGPDHNLYGPFAYFRGNWRPVPMGGATSGIKYFFGRWTDFFDSTGLGVAGSAWDGYALCNGNNGTPDLRNTFLVSGNFYNGSQWVTQIESAGTYKPSGGQSLSTLSVYNLPPLTWQILVEEEFAGAAGDNSDICSTDTGAGHGTDSIYYQGANMWNPARVGGLKPIYTLPPYIVLGAVMWVGLT